MNSELNETLRRVSLVLRTDGLSIYPYKCFLSVCELTNIVSQCTLDLISWKILLKICCLKCLIRYDTGRWWAELNDARWFHPYLNTVPVVKLLTHYTGLYDLSRE